MKRVLLSLPLLLLCALPLKAQTFATGWTSVTGTNYASLCPNAGGARPDVQGNSGCSGVMDAWAGGFADTKLNRLCFTGGGHHDYYGNEVYCFDPSAGTISRLDQASDASTLNTNTNTYDAMPDGTAGARHTYGGITYDPVTNAMMIQGGSPPSPGSLTNSTWTLSLAGLSSGVTGTCCWTNKNPTISGGTMDNQFGNLLNYDPVSNSMFLWEAWQSNPGNLWQYNRTTNTWNHLATYGSGSLSNNMDGYQSGAIDPKDGYFFAIGNGKLLRINIASDPTYAVTNLAGTATGCTTPAAYTYPGVDWDSSIGRIVVWNGGDTAYLYDPVANSCTAETHTGGPASVALNGTFGRFQFLPVLGIHVTCPTSSSNCYTLKLNADAPQVNSWASMITGVNTPGGAGSIVNTQDFDTFPTTNLQHYFQLYKPAQITTDCTNAADGCSLEFTMNPGDFQGQPGWYSTNFNSTNTALYGAGSEFYIQFRERMSPSMLQSSTWSLFEGSKQAIISEGDNSSGTQAGNCSNTPTDGVIQNGSSAPGSPIIYWNCGNNGTLKFMDSAYEPVQLSTPSDVLDQVTSGCPHYGPPTSTIPKTDPTCWNYVGNEWMTVQIHVKVGTYGTASSVEDLWFCHQNTPCQLISNAADMDIVDSPNPSVTDKFGKLTLMTYATNATWQTLANAWFDDLIISNRRIPDPNVNTPNAPDSLSLSGISSGHITVNWRVNSNNGYPQDDTGFKVERCTGTPATCFPNPQSGFTQIATTAPHATSYTDTSAPAGSTYTYRVRATNPYGDSGYAASVCFNNALPCGGTAAGSGASGAVSTPTFSPVAGTYMSSQTVTLSTTTGGATIVYTLDGTTPTANGNGNATHGMVYTVPLILSTTVTLKAIASEAGFSDSAVSSGTFNILLPARATSSSIFAAKR